MSARKDRYIIFHAASMRWAIAAAGVLEVLPTLPLDRPTGSPRALAGFANVDGAPLAVIRLAALFGEETSGSDDLYHHILRLAASGARTPMALLVDRVTDVDARADGMAPLDGSHSINGAVIGNLVIKESLVPLLDWGRLLLIEEQQRIADLAEAARGRLADLTDRTAP